MSGKLVVAGTTGVARSPVPILNANLEVSRGNVPGETAVFKFGHNSSINSSTTADVWDGGASSGGDSLIWLAPTAARIHNLASDNAADTSDGAGCRTILVFGLVDWDTPEVSEIVTLNGTTPVATVNSYVIIHRMVCLTWGATSVNVGTLKATAVTDNTVTARINPSNGQTQMTIYGVPSGFSLYVSHGFAVANKASGSSASGDLTLNLCPSPQLDPSKFRVIDLAGIRSDIGALDKPYPFPGRIQGPCILKATVASNSAGLDISVSLDGVLIDDAL